MDYVVTDAVLVSVVKKSQAGKPNAVIKAVLIKTHMKSGDYIMSTVTQAFETWNNKHKNEYIMIDHQYIGNVYMSKKDINATIDEI